jgi:hypothetical protein
MRCTFSPKPPVSLPVFLIGLICSVTVLPSLTRAVACFVFSGVIKLSKPRSSSLPQRPQFESSFSHFFSFSKDTRREGSCVEGWGLNGAAFP